MCFLVTLYKSNYVEINLLFIFSSHCLQTIYFKLRKFAQTEKSIFRITMLARAHCEQLEREQTNREREGFCSSKKCASCTQKLIMFVLVESTRELDSSGDWLLIDAFYTAARQTHLWWCRADDALPKRASLFMFDTLLMNAPYLEWLCA